MDIGMIAKLLKNPSDLPTAAKSMGMEYSTIPPGPFAERAKPLEKAFETLAALAMDDKAEVIELHGYPALLKGKRVRVIAVLEDAEKK
ncbi:MAG TPA: hypothetical protein VFB79_07625 [Candidatus Angelobacter sp.]|nr:hypothetical protein [Candidatus Angelobacter sp.]